MSHVANVEVVIQDLQALQSACAALGLHFKHGQRTYAWFNNYLADSDVGRQTVRDGFDPETFGKCEHAIGVPGSRYEIGVVKNPNGVGYRLIADAYGHNADPVADGRCCDLCNYGSVIPRRLREVALEKHYSQTRAIFSAKARKTATRNH